MKKNLIKESTELLKDLDDAFLDYTLDEFANWEYAFDLIDRARSILYTYIREATQCQTKKKTNRVPLRRPSTTSSSKHTTLKTRSSKRKKSTN